MLDVTGLCGLVLELEQLGSSVLGARRQKCIVGRDVERVDILVVDFEREERLELEREQCARQGMSDRPAFKIHNQSL